MAASAVRLLRAEFAPPLINHIRRRFVETIVQVMPVPGAKGHETARLNETAQQPPSRTRLARTQGPDLVETHPSLHVRPIVEPAETDGHEVPGAKFADQFLAFPIRKPARRNAIQQIHKVRTDEKQPTLLRNERAKRQSPHKPAIAQRTLKR